MGIFDKLRGKKTDSHDHGAHDHATHDHGEHDHATHSHGEHDHATHSHGAHDHDDAHLPEGAAGAKHDPVCDMWVDPAKAPAKSEHAGETIYFCAPGCKRAFDKDPAKYMPKLKRSG